MREYSTPAAMKPLARAVTSSANCRAVMSRQAPFAGAGASTVPPLARITTAAGLRAARSKTTSARVAEAGYPPQPACCTLASRLLSLAVASA